VMVPVTLSVSTLAAATPAASAPRESARPLRVPQWTRQLSCRSGTGSRSAALKPVGTAARAPIAAAERSELPPRTVRDERDEAYTSNQG